MNFNSGAAMLAFGAICSVIFFIYSVIVQQWILAAMFFVGVLLLAVFTRRSLRLGR